MLINAQCKILGVNHRGYITPAASEHCNEELQFTIIKVNGSYHSYTSNLSLTKGQI